jgi:hypothetical protein
MASNNQTHQRILTIVALFVFRKLEKMVVHCRFVQDAKTSSIVVVSISRSTGNIIKLFAAQMKGLQSLHFSNN